MARGPYDYKGSFGKLELLFTHAHIDILWVLIYTCIIYTYVQYIKHCMMYGNANTLHNRQRGSHCQRFQVQRN